MDSNDNVPQIKELPHTKLVGLRVRMSLARNTTAGLWQKFMLRRREIKNAAGGDLYSVEIYDSSFFQRFDATREFEKWAAVQVNDHEQIPEDMEPLTLPAGLYAVFTYRGKPSEAQNFYRYIFEEWILRSAYTLDHRPHFAIMGAHYKGEHPDSEEEVWIPVKNKRSAN